MKAVPSSLQEASMPGCFGFHETEFTTSLCPCHTKKFSTSGKQEEASKTRL